MMLLVKMDDSRSSKRTWVAVLAFAIMTVGPYVILFWILTRH